MVDERSLPVFRDLALAHGGRITLALPTGEASGETPIHEYTWNHTTPRTLKTDRGVTYLQCLYQADRILESAAEMSELFGDELFHHMEFIRFVGRHTCSGLPVLRYRGKERLQAIIDAHEAHVVCVANPHVVTLEDGSRHKRVNADHFGFKHEVDPLELLNPGKTRTYRLAARETPPCKCTSSSRTVP